MKYLAYIKNNVFFLRARIRKIDKERNLIIISTQYTNETEQNATIRIYPSCITLIWYDKNIYIKKIEERTRTQRVLECERKTIYVHTYVCTYNKIRWNTKLDDSLKFNVHRKFRNDNSRDPFILRSRMTISLKFNRNFNISTKIYLVTLLIT